jgi:hypothetical protein
MKSLATSLALILLILVTSGRASSFTLEKDDTQLDADLADGNHIKLEVKTRTTPDCFVYAHSYDWGGNPSAGTPRIVYESGTRTYVPLSAYADLGDPRSASLSISGADTFTLTIIGGGTGDAYTATFWFRDGNITRKTIVSSEFPDEVWEQTTYRYIIEH